MALLLLVCGCGSGDRHFLVRIDAETPAMRARLALQTIEVTIRNDAGAPTNRYTIETQAITLPASFSVDVADGVSGTLTLSIRAFGSDKTMVAATGTGMVDVANLDANGKVELQITLRPP